MLKEIFVQKFVFIERQLRVRQFSVCCHGYKFTMEKKKSIASVLIRGSMYQTSSSEHLHSTYLQLCYENAAIIAQNLVFKQ